MKRAMRCDKMTIAALTALLELYRKPGDLVENLPALALLARKPGDIRRQAQDLVEPLHQRLGERVRVRVVDCDSVTGSGALPNHRLPSAAIELSPAGVADDALLRRIAHAFRHLPVPVIGRVHQGRFLLDCRCLEDSAEFTALLDQLETGHW